MITVEQIISLLKLKPHPEGGFFSETYRSGESIPGASLPSRYSGERAHSTAIYYLLAGENRSAMHRVRSDEIFHHYLGDPVEMLHLFPDGSGRIVILGPDLPGGMAPQVLIPHDSWQGARLVPGGAFALMGATVSPGFDFSDFELGERGALTARYPEFRDLITALT
ncbi:MAG: cupin domain-containing protein [Spirochaetes bacterium]|nr:MAG: cupin domain-containing protein [Spirochaetota bacterium]